MIPISRRSALCFILMSVAGFCLAASQTGCAVISWTVAQFAPPQKVSAVYKPPKNKKYLVLVDDALSPPGEYEVVKKLLTRKMSVQLVDKGIARSTVEYREISDLVARTPNFQQLAVSQIGQMLGADVVLYVHLDTFQIKDSQVSQFWHGQFTTTVRLIDVQNGRLWPTDRPRGHKVGPLEMPTEENPSATYGIELTEKLVDGMADRIAKLFYDHRVPVQQTIEHHPA